MPHSLQNSKFSALKIGASFKVARCKGINFLLAEADCLIGNSALGLKFSATHS
jgi:hypothetical protein